MDENTNFLSFNDFMDISEYAQQPVFWALEKDMLQPIDMDILPAEPATRAQVAHFLHLFCEAYQLLG